MWNLQRIKSISNILTKEACERLVIGLVISQPDYTNCLYIGYQNVILKNYKEFKTLQLKLCLKKGRKFNHMPEETKLATNCTENKIQSFDLGL